MKVLVVTNLYPTEKKNNWGTFVYEQVESLRSMYSNEITIDVYLVDGSESKLNYIKGFFSLPFMVKKKGYDLVHVHYGITLFSVLLVNVPVIVTWHGSDLLVPPAKHLSQILKHKACYSIVVSKNLQRALGDGVVIPCGIDTKKFSLPSDYVDCCVSKNRDLCGRELKILFPSNPIVKVKNYSLFHSVCVELKKKGVVVTEVYLMDVVRDKVPSVFWDCDVMLLTSFSEGSPTVVKEAIAAKLPFVSVDVGDVKEWCELTSFGLVEEDCNPRNIAEKLLSLLDSIGERNSLDNLCAIEKIDLVNSSKLVKSVYDDIVCKKIKSL